MDAQPQGQHRGTDTLILFLLVVGVGLRVAYFLPDTALWGDEAAVAQNLQARTYSELLEPLAGNQHAPLAFLLVEKALFEACGLNERCLRLPALGASIAALVGFAFLVRVLLIGRLQQALALAMMSLSPSLIRYSAELKPYSFDVLASVLVLIAAIRYLNQDVSHARVAMWSLGAVAMVTTSFASVIVLFGVGMTLMATALKARRRTQLALVLPLAAGAVAFIAQHLAVTRHSVANRELLDFWSYAFISFPPTSLWEVRQTITVLTRPFQDPLGLLDTALPAALAILGVAALERQRRWLGVLLVSPIAVTAALSAAHLWPFSTRLVLFFCPILACLVASGTGAVLSNLPGRLPVVALTGALLYGQVVGARDAIGTPERSGLRSVLRVIAGAVSDGDHIYVYYKSTSTFDLYRRRTLPRDRLDVTVGQRIDGVTSRMDQDIRTLVGRPRVWVVFSEVNRFFTDERAVFLAKLDASGSRLKSYEVDGASAYLYDLTSR